MDLPPDPDRDTGLSRDEAFCALRRDVVLACRILELEGVAQQAFNVSVRHDQDRMIAVPVTSPLLVTAESLESTPLADGSPHWKAHPAIYRARPDVGAIVHCHPPHVTAFSCLDEPFVPVHHYGAPFHGKLARYASPGQTSSEGRANEMARQLGDGRAILQRGHGVVVVGKDICEALILTLFLEEAIRTRLLAEQLGAPRYLTREESEKITPQILKPRSQDKAWNHFVSRLKLKGYLSDLDGI